MTARTTAIKVHGETWHVPRGFGRQYLECVKEQHPATLQPGEYLARVRNLLLLIGYEATTEQISEWPLRKRIEAEIYARNVHLRASDNIMQAYPPPDWLPQPWQGDPRDVSHIREDLRGAFEGPGPTRIVEDREATSG